MKKGYGRYLIAMLCVAIVLAVFLAACSGGEEAATPTPKPTATPSNIVGAVKTATAPQLDGSAEAAWGEAQAVKIPVSGGANNGLTTVELKALYTADSIYFLAQWADPTESFQRAPWQKSADGTWHKLSDPNDKGGDSNLYYEDKLAFIWNINDSISGFNEQGCMIFCHVGEGKPFGNKYTANAGEVGDIWHWKSVRTGPVGQIDDQYLDSTRYDSQTAPEAGRKSDPKTSGGYSDNKTQDGKLPQWALPNNKPAPPYWILDTEKVAFDTNKYASDNEVPGIIVAPFVGDRADISGKGVWKDGKWTLEWGRKLQTGSQYDVQFSSLDKTYYFGAAAFDNAQVRHSFSSGAYKLIFLVKPTATPVATAKPTATPTVAPTAKPTATPTVAPTVKPTATPTTAPTATPSPTSGGPPLIPASHADRTSGCVTCHKDGLAGAPKFPASHASYTDGMCTGCHQRSP